MKPADHNQATSIIMPITTKKTLTQPVKAINATLKTKNREEN